MLRVETGTERLVRATLEHRVGEPLLVGYQTGGFSGSAEVPGWRTFVTTEIEGPRPGFSAEAHAMVEIFARA